MESWIGRYPGIISAAVCLILLLSFLTGCTSRMDSRQSGWFGSKQGDMAVTSEHIRKLIAETRPQLRHPQAHFRQGLMFQARGQHQQAIEEFNKVLLMDPGHIKALNAIGVSFDNAGHHEKAVRHYQAALNLNPQLDYIHNNLGYSYFLQSNYTAAVESFQRAIDINSEITIYHNNLGMAYAQQGRFKEALTRFEKSPVTDRALDTGQPGTRKVTVQDKEPAAHKVRAAVVPPPAKETQDFSAIEPQDFSAIETKEFSAIETKDFSAIEPLARPVQEVAEPEKILYKASERAAIPAVEVRDLSDEQEISDPPQAEPPVQEIFISRQKPSIKPGPILEEPAAYPQYSLEPSEEQSIVPQQEETPYTVQVGAFEIGENAAKIHAGLLEKGYSSRIAEPGTDRFHRVQVGTYSSLEKAQTAARALARAENIETWIPVENRPPLQSAASAPPAQGNPFDWTRVSHDFLDYVPLEVLNGNGVRHMARKISSHLEKHGFRVNRVGNAGHFNYPRTTIYYRPGNHLVAEMLASQFSHECEMRQLETSTLPHVGVRLVIGKDLAGYNSLLQDKLAAGGKWKGSTPLIMHRSMAAFAP